jgi:hypothetical protein
MTKSFRWITAMLVTATIGCENTSSNYCENAPFHNCQNLVDAPKQIDAGQQCTTSANCTMAPNTTCDIPTMTCVDCLANTDCSVGTMPICAADHSCRACTDDAECGGPGVCLPSGACATDQEVAFVKASGTLTNPCTQAAPCSTITFALTKLTPAIKVDGPIVEGTATTMSNPALVIDRSVKIVGNATASVTRLTNGPIVEYGGASTVTIQLKGIKIFGASGPASGATGIRLRLGDSAALELVGAGVAMNAGVGIAASGGTVSVTSSTVTSNAGGGIAASGGTVSVTSSTVTSNEGGGILSNGCTFNIANNIIARNGKDDKEFGGVKIVAPSSGMRNFSNNTVVYNHAVSNASAAGVSCTGTMTGSANIVTSNDVAAGTDFSKQTGTCGFEAGSYIANGDASNALKFASFAGTPLNFHLTTASPASVHNVAGLTACTGTDIDGETRPKETLCDLGADEYDPANPHN